MTPGALLVLAATLVAPPPGLPHTALSASVPAADSVETGEVREIRLRFTTAVQAPLSGITVIGPEGSVTVGAVETVPGSDGVEIRVPLPDPLPSGAYTVEWRTAGPDNHVIRGSFDFLVDRPPPPEVTQEVVPAAVPPPPSAAPDLAPAIPQVALYGLGGLSVGWLFLVSVVGMVGSVLFRVAVVGRLDVAAVPSDVLGALERRMLVPAGLIAVLAVAALPARLMHQAFLVAGPAGALAPAAFRLMGSPWGSAWMVQLSGVSLFVAGFLLARRNTSAPGPWGIMGLGAALTAVVPGLSGHAATGGVLLLATDAAHVLAAGTWVGGLACLVLVGIPVTAVGAGVGLPAVVSGFSRVALPAVAVLVLSGLVNGVANLSVQQLLDTPYGRLLLIKVVGALGAFSLGYYNWRVVRPALTRDPNPSRLRIPATVELAVGVAILALTAALVVTARP